MKLLILLLGLITFSAHALEAVVTVLEAPMFREKNIDSMVVQYLRKGDVIKIHPSLEHSEDLEFTPTLDRQGKTVYVLSDHIYVYYNDSREFTQRVAKKDPTDYRLEEPLPEAYPLLVPSGHRGQILFGVSQPYNESYAYPDPVKTKGYASPAQIFFGILRKVPHDTKDRFYFGGNVNLKTHQNSYTFFDYRQSREQYIQFGIGPMISYDAYKGEENRLNLSLSINFNPINYLTITQGNTSISDERIYRGYNFSSRIGLQYHRKEIFKDIDFVLGTTLDIESPATFQAQNEGTQKSWWQNIGGDKFTTRGYFSLTGIVGLQTAY